MRFWCPTGSREAVEHLAITQRVGRLGVGDRCPVPFTRRTSDLESEPYRYGWNIGTPQVSHNFALSRYGLGIALRTRSAANVAQRTFVIVRRLIPGAGAREAKDKSPPPGLPS